MADNTTYCKVPEKKQYTEQVRRWSRNTRANGDEMGADIEKLLNNDAYLKEKFEELDGNAVKDGDKGAVGGIATLNNDGKLAQHVDYGNVDNVPAPKWDKIEGKPTYYPPSSHTHHKSAVGLENVNNTADADKEVAYAAKAGDADTVDGKHASAFAVKNHSHSYAGSDSSGGSAIAAEKLATSRNITIGNKSKGFDGSANVSFTLEEIGTFVNGGKSLGTAGQDFNDFIVPGFYEVGVNAFATYNIKNYPALAPWGFLLVFSNGWVTLQIYIPNKTVDNGVPQYLNRYMPRGISNYKQTSYNNYEATDDQALVTRLERQFPSMAIRSRWGNTSTATWTEWRYIWGSAWNGAGLTGEAES